MTHFPHTDRLAAKIRQRTVLIRQLTTVEAGCNPAHERKAEFVASIYRPSVVPGSRCGDLFSHL